MGGKIRRNLEGVLPMERFRGVQDISQEEARMKGQASVKTKQKGEEHLKVNRRLRRFYGAMVYAKMLNL